MVKYIGYRIQLQHLVMPNKLLLLCVFFFLKKMLIIIKSFNYVFKISFFFLFTLYINFNVLFWSKLLCQLLYYYISFMMILLLTTPFFNFLKHFKTLLRVRVILVTLCDIYILVVMYRHILFLFDSVPGNKALECISVSYTTENVISLSLKCSSV